MRRIAFALALLTAVGWAAPSQAQWWGGGWGRPCFGRCGPWAGGGGWGRPGRFVVLGFMPRPVWSRPGAFGPPVFRPAAWGWRRRAWMREMRWRRFEAWRRWAEIGRGAATVAVPGPRVRRWARAAAPVLRPEPARPAPEGRRAPDRAEGAVALVPVAPLRLARPRAAIPSRVLAAAAMMRRPAAPLAVVPAVAPEPPPRPEAPRPTAAVSRHPRTAAARAFRTTALRSQPAPAVPVAVPAPAPPLAAPEAQPGDVPVAPLD